MEGMYYRKVKKYKMLGKLIQGPIEFITKDELAKNTIEQPLNLMNLQTLKPKLRSHLKIFEEAMNQGEITNSHESTQRRKRVHPRG